MNILVTTIINSTKNVEQLLSLLNTSTDVFTYLPDEFYTFKRKHNLTSVDECWIITLNKHGFSELKDFCRTCNCKIRIFRCSSISVSGLDSEDELKKFKSLLYNVVLKAKEIADKLYLSSVEGTIYGDMQEAARIFGCDYFLHIKNNSNVPLMIQKDVPASLLISTDDDISSLNFILKSVLDRKESEQNFEIYDIQLDYQLLDELEIRNKQAIHLYGNFYGMEC